MYMCYASKILFFSQNSAFLDLLRIIVRHGVDMATPPRVARVLLLGSEEAHPLKEDLLRSKILLNY